MSSKSAILLVLLLALVTVVYQVASRLSSDALNVIVGVLCGVTATVPVSLGLLLALSRGRREPAPVEEEHEPEGPAWPDRAPYYDPRQPRSPYPQVIVVAPPQIPSSNPYPNLLPPGAMSPGYNMHEPPQTREFKIIGDDEDWDA